jgi:GPH family glycoside/pentoside/hexuronide:cation symporter
MSNLLSPHAASKAAPKPTRLAWRERIAYGFGDVASSLYFQIFIAYLAFFYTDVFGISAVALGTMIFVVRTIDWTTDIVMGAIADRTHSRWGRYRPWLLWSIIPFVGSGILMFTTPDISQSAKLVYAYATYTLCVLVYTMINVPYSALMGVMTSNSEERTVLSSARVIGSGLAGVIIFATIVPLREFFGESVNPQRAFTLTVAVYAIIAAGAFLFTFMGTRERIRVVPTKDDSLRRDLRLLTKNGPWLILITVSLLTIISMALRAGSTVHFFKYVVGNESLAAGVLLVGAATQMVAVASTKYIARLFGSKKAAYAALMILMSLLNFGFYFIPTDRPDVYTAFQIAATFASGPIIALFFAMIADTASYGLVRLKQKSTGLLFSGGTFSLKLGWSIGPAAAMWLLGYVGFQANVAQSEGTLLGLKMMMSFVPGAVGLIAAAVLLAFYKINGEMEQQIESEVRVLEEQSER